MNVNASFNMPLFRNTLLGMLCLIFLPGCNLVGYFFAVGGGEQEREVAAMYRGLKGKTGAVFVMVPGRILNRYPGAATKVCEAITHRLVESEVAAKLVDPEQVLTYQERNPAWFATPYDQLVRSLKLERLIIVDLSEYQITPEGDMHTLQAEIKGGIGVYEYKDTRKSKFDFYTEIVVREPDNEPAALLDEDVKTIEEEVVQMFSKKAGNLFMDHVKVEVYK